MQIDLYYTDEKHVEYDVVKYEIFPSYNWLKLNFKKTTMWVNIDPLSRIVIEQQ